MKKFKVYYHFDGAGYIVVEAKTAEEAGEIFLSGEADETLNCDRSENYCVEHTEEITN